MLRLNLQFSPNLSFSTFTFLHQQEVASDLVPLRILHHIFQRLSCELQTPKQMAARDSLFPSKRCQGLQAGRWGGGQGSCTSRQEGEDARGPTVPSEVSWGQREESREQRPPVGSSQLTSQRNWTTTIFLLAAHDTFFFKLLNASQTVSNTHNEEENFKV